MAATAALMDPIRQPLMLLINIFCLVISIVQILSIIKSVVFTVNLLTERSDLE